MGTAARRAAAILKHDDASWGMSQDSVKEEFTNFAALADTHHVIVRALSVLQSTAARESRAVVPSSASDKQLAERCESALADERARIDRAVGYLHLICSALEARGCRVAVIKSLDHWPDLGSDLDLYTTADEHAVEQAMGEEFGAERIERSWGDRLANKWNLQSSRAAGVG